MTIGELLYNYRKQHNMTMQEFADKSGLSKGYISMLEKGRHPQSNRSLIPSVETVDKIASAMGISIDELLQMVDGDQLVSLKNSKKEHHPLPPNVIIPAAHGIPILGTICCGDGIEKPVDSRNVESTGFFSVFFIVALIRSEILSINSYFLLDFI